MITLALVDDETLLLDAMSRLLTMEKDLEISWTAKNGDEALTRCRNNPPNVLVVDVEMPGMSGLELTESCLALPEAPRVLVLTTFSRPGYLRRAVDAGARGYLLKDSPVDSLVNAIRAVADGRRVFGSKISDALRSAHACPLTDREKVILSHAARGLSNKVIARILGVSPGTVRNRLSDAMEKLGAENRVAAALTAEANGWLR